MTPECDAIDCERKSVHAVYKTQILKFHSIAVQVKILLCPDHFNEAMEHQAKREKLLDEIAQQYRVEN